LGKPKAVAWENYEASIVISMPQQDAQHVEYYRSFLDNLREYGAEIIKEHEQQRKKDIRG
jgi:hypothetical protein